MSKRKILVLALTIAMAAILAIGGTLAYFTDNDQVKNVFTIGDLKIDVYEDGGIIDKDGNVVQEIVETEQEGIKYENLMPTYKIQKEPYIANKGENAAYVRVAVVMNNVDAINDAIDDVYEYAGYTDEQIQEVYDTVFEGWGVNYTKRHVNGHNDRRMWMDGRGEPVLFNVDMYCKMGGYGMYDVKNQFMSEMEKTRLTLDGEGFDYENTGYYSKAVKTDERIYVFYLKLEGGQGYKLFEGLNVPADFSNVAKTSYGTVNQMAMFDGLKIGVYADAIQIVGFDTAEDAFTALEAEHPLGWWN